MLGRAALRRCSLLAALAAALPATAAAQLAAPPSAITYFGDSFTDTGNGDAFSLAMLGFDLTPTPPYADGRASNGFVWADYLTQAFGLGATAPPSAFGGRNFAIGTARTGAGGAVIPPPFGTGAPAPVGMLTQRDLYLAAAGGGLPTPASGLYVLFGGANDIADAAALGTPAAQLAALHQAVDNIEEIVTSLHGLGARQFLIPSVPDVGLTPQALAVPGASQLLGTLTDQFNTLLAMRLAELGATFTDSDFFGLRLDILFDNILADARNGGPLYGLTNTTAPCIAAPALCGTSVFFDQEHPTTRAHELIAEAAFLRLTAGADVSAIPEPSTVVLLAGGLVLLAAGARRRARR